ncbi:MAG: amidohydrolase [Eubacterium sp.]|nr:amidohydrolase [Eubacterium sp.]
MKADTLFKNGKIYTLVNEGDCAEALAVKDGRIVFVGSNADAADIEACEVVDLGGRTMLPGLGDSHLHFFAYCQTLTTVDLGAAKSKKEAMQMLADKAAETPAGEWIRGNNFDQSKWSDCEDEIPTKADLDAVSTEHPIFMKRVCLHTAVANSKALEVAGVGKDYEFGVGGLVELDENGYPNGILREQAPKIFDEIIPDPAKVPEIKAKLMDTALAKAAREGVTQIHTYAADIWKYTEDFDDYKALERAGKLPLRVSIYLDTYYTKPYLTQKEVEDPYRLVQYGGYKIFSDGSLGSRSAALFEPYDDDPTTTGIFVQSQDALNEKMLKAYEMGLQPATHCIGDAGLDAVLTAIEYTLAKSREHGMTEREQATRDPFRIIHAQMARPELIERMCKLPVVIDIQPSFYCTDLHWIEDRVGAERAAHSYQWKTYIDKGLILTGGSDCPVEDFNPWYGIYAAVTRKDLEGYPEGGCHPEEKVSPYEAICMFSKNIAIAIGQQAQLGTLEAGKFADMVVVEQDPFEIPEDELLHVVNDQTWVAGRKVFERA